MPKRPSLKLGVEDMDESLLSELIDLSHKVGWVGEQTELGDVIQHMDMLRSMAMQKRMDKGTLQRIDAASEDVQSMAMALAYERLRQDAARPVARRKMHQPEAGMVESIRLSRHEREVETAALKKMLSGPLGFWRDVERHFPDKRMSKMIQSYIDGTCDERVSEAITDKYLSLPSGVSEKESQQVMERWLIMNHIGDTPGLQFPAYAVKVYGFMRSAKSHAQKLAAYIVLRETMDNDERLVPRIIGDADLSKMDVHRSCMLLSIASDHGEWVKGVGKLLGAGKAGALMEDLISYCKDEPCKLLKGARTLGGEGSVVRLDFGGDDVVLFRFGDARSHALGYKLLGRYGFPAPEYHELHASMCSLELLEDGKTYGDSAVVSRKAANELGRILAACFVFGIPDPNETNFIVQGDKVVRIDADSAPYGWNYYADSFIAGADMRKPNDSYAFSRLLSMKRGTSESISKGFTDGLDSLRQALSAPGEIDKLCAMVKQEYSDAYIYRTSGEGLDEKVLARLRRRLESLLKSSSSDLLKKAERGQEVR
jgi:hypothetical protein